MKFTIEKNIFVKLLSNVCNVAAKKTVADSNDYVILQNIKIEVKDGFLYLVGTDSDTYIKNKIVLNNSENGATTVPAMLLNDFVKRVEDGAEIECEYVESENIFSLKTGKGNFKFLCLDASLYPNFEIQDTSVEFKLAPKDFINIIDKTKSSICDDQARYYLCGLFIHITEENGEKVLSGVSTDGHRLSLINVKNFNVSGDFSGVIIPKKTLKEIRNVLIDCQDEEVSFSLSKTKIKIETSNTLMISKLIDADFPDYKRVIPQANDKILKCDKKLLTNILSRVSVFANEAHKGVKFILSNNTLVLESGSPERGSASEEIKVDFDSDAKIEAGFNSKFMIEFFNQIESDIVCIYFKDNSSAIMIKGEEELDNTFVLMPIRI